MKYRCSNGHENHADAAPQRCPVCGSSLIKVISTGSAIDTKPPAPKGPPSLPQGSGAPAKPRRSSPLVAVALAAAAVLIVGLAWVALGRRDSDQQVMEVAKKFESAVGLVVLSGKTDDGTFTEPIATAWAVADKVFVSNGHVAKPVADNLARGGSAFIVLNKNPGKTLRITSAKIHPRYNETSANLDGKDPAVPAYDIGLLYVDSVAPSHMPVAPAAELAKLDSGYRVAYLGFPMENMSGGGVDFRNPVANMQSGIITSVSDWWLSKAPFEKSLLLSHNLGAAGGASGSPIFNPAGQVVGVLSAGNIIGQVDLATGKRTRAPSAVMINFGQRIDILKDIYPDYPK